MNPSRITARRITALLAAAFVSLLAAGSAQAAQNGKIAFERLGDIYVANPNGTNRTNLTATKTYEAQASFSPDGSRIAFVRDSTAATLADDDLWVMDADGSNQVMIADASDRIEGLRWSGDGTRLLYWADRDTTETLAELYSVNPDGSGDTLLSAQGPPIDEGGLVVTTAGDKVAWADETVYGNYEILLSRIDLAGITRVTNDPAVDASPVLSPDGSRVAWASNRDHPGERGGTEIYVANTDGSMPTRVTSSGAKKDNSPSAFSPDGTRIGYDHYGHASVIHVDGTSPVSLTDGKTFDHFERFSPDGTRALYEHVRPVRGEDIHVTIDTVRLNGKGHRVVVGKALDPDYLDWQSVTSPAPAGPLELSIDARPKQQGKGLRISYTCSNECDLIVAAKGEAGGRPFESTTHAHGYGNDPWETSVLNRKARRLVDGKRGEAKIVVTARDQFGGTRTDKARVKLIAG